MIAILTIALLLTYPLYSLVTWLGRETIHTRDRIIVRNRLRAYRQARERGDWDGGR